MGLFKPLSYREVKRRLEAAGFEEYSQRGSNVKFIKHVDQGIVTVVVPHHRDVAAGTQHSILRQAQISIFEWDDL